MKKKALMGILSIVGCTCFGVGAVLAASANAVVGSADALQTVQSVYADTDIRKLTDTVDEAYYRADLSYYANGTAIKTAYCPCC